MSPWRRHRIVGRGDLLRTVAALAILAFVTGQLACDAQGPPGAAERPAATSVADSPRAPEDAQGQEPFARARRRMIEEHLAGRDITDPRVLEAMRKVPRHRFVPDGLARRAYGDSPLPIGHNQTISQPYIVALMTQLAEPKPDSRALDVGTGSGYQAAVLAELSKEVYSIEIVKPLAEQAKKRLAELGYDNVTVKAGDGYRGWPEKAPFDAIIVAAAPDHVPEPLVDQLAPGGRMVIPVGKFYQELLLIEKDKSGKAHRKSIAPVMFVPMTGEAEKRKEEKPEP